MVEAAGVEREFGSSATYWWRTTSGPNSRLVNWFRTLAVSSAVLSNPLFSTPFLER
jgi:hypothetical protein